MLICIFDEKLILQLKSKVMLNDEVRADLFRYGGLVGIKGFLRGLLSCRISLFIYLPKSAEI